MREDPPNRGFYCILREVTNQKNSKNMNREKTGILMGVLMTTMASTMGKYYLLPYNQLKLKIYFRPLHKSHTSVKDAKIHLMGNKEINIFNTDMGQVF